VELKQIGLRNRLQFNFFKESKFSDRKKISIEISSGKVLGLNLQFTVPVDFKAGDYMFLWQLVECGTGAIVGNPFTLNQTLCEPLEPEKEKKLSQLYDFGFTDRATVIEIFDECGWQLNQALDILLHK